VFAIFEPDSTGIEEKATGGSERDRAAAKVDVEIFSSHRPVLANITPVPSVQPTLVVSSLPVRQVAEGVAGHELPGASTSVNE
jgi:hypothetical protein